MPHQDFPGDQAPETPSPAAITTTAESFDTIGPDASDAFGQMLIAAHAASGTPGTVFEITERDDGHISVRDASFYFTPLTPESEDSRCLSTLDGPVLDVGCGAGRHLTFLAAQGISAQGIDISPGAVEVCTARGLTAWSGNIFDPPSSLAGYPAILMLGGNLGILGSPAQAPKLLAALGRLAAPGAKLFAEGIDVTATRDPVHLAYQRRNVTLGRDPAQLRIRVRHRQLAGAWSSLWFPTPQQLETATTATGWRLSHVDNEGAGFRAELIWDRP